MNRRAASFLLLCPIVLAAATVDPEPYRKEVEFLASPELKGRATGSPELEKAAEYIASQFRAFGLKPVDGKDFELSFPARLGAELGPNNRLAARENGQRVEMKEGQDFEPFSFSTTGRFEGGLVFAGYGITAKEYSYDDYAGLDVRGKIVLILRHEPQEHRANSVFNGAKLTRHSEFLRKMVNAKQHGARGVIWVNDADAHNGPDRLEKFGFSEGPRDAGIFYLQVSRAVAERWLATDGKDLKTVAEDIDRDLKPRSFALSKIGLDLNVDLIHKTATVHNVAAYLPGATDEYIVIGAHFDHLGMGDQHSLAPNARGTIHPGADDNASGTAGVIELARWFSTQPKPKRGILFMTFAGEELGLLGSAWYTEHPVLPLDKAVAMINLDMIGRIRDGRVFVSGLQTGTTLNGIFDATPVPDGIRFDQTGRNSGTNMNDASDHASFSAKQIPVVFFFSGLHGDYHKPTDTADKIDASSATKLIGFVGDFAQKMAAASDRPKFVRVARPAPAAHDGKGTPSGRPASNGYGPYFGSIPDFNEPPKGVRFADIREGSPAAVAGIKAGDILVEFDGKEVSNMYDFTYALQDHQPGQTVPVKVLRDGQIIEAKVLLTERR